MKAMFTALGFVLFGVISVSPAFGQSPTPGSTETPVTGGGSMTLTGRVPAPAGTKVRVEALDPASTSGFVCDQATSASVAGDATLSTFSLVVAPDCVSGRSANLRICWSMSDCAQTTFEAGATRDLGTLESQFFTPPPPEGGSGTEPSPTPRATPSAAPRELPSTGEGAYRNDGASPLTVVFAAVILVAVGSLGLVRRRA